MVKRYHQKHKEKLRKEAHERYQNLSEEKKEKKVYKKLLFTTEIFLLFTYLFIYLFIY